jgi:rhodanese-related sulfurtransferase
VNACSIDQGEKTSVTSERPLPTRIVHVEKGGSYTDVYPAGLTTMLTNKDFLLINVHIPYVGEIENTDLFMAYNEIKQNLQNLPENKNAKIVLYCRSGSMSTSVVKELIKLGYTNVWHLNGGMLRWKQAGNKIVYRDKQ